MSRLLPLLLLATLLSGTTLHAATIEGRIVRDNVAQAGMVVTAHASVDPTAPVVAQTVSDADGLYRLHLPAGRYALFARDHERGLFAFFGRNPLQLKEEERLWAGLQTVVVTAVQYEPYDDPYSAALAGIVLSSGRPLSGAIVTLYLDSTDELKGQGYRMSLPTGEDGRFFFDGLPEADYHLVARRHADGSRVGPVRDGDDLATFPGNPLHLSAGKTTRIALHTIRKVKETPGSEVFGQSSELSLTGMIVDRQGVPQAGLHLFAYRDKVIGHKRPEAISPPTAADGRFHIAFPGPGTYYIGAREKYGDSPAPGELFGMYETSADHGLEISNTKKNEPLRIIVEPVNLN